jgi:ribosomal RNA-processing protein 9
MREVLEGGLKGDEEGNGVVEDDTMDSPSRATLKEGDVAKKFIEGSIESVAMIDETTFVCGGDSG